MFQPGIWGKDEIISAGPTRCPDGEIGRGKEIGELEGAQAWDPKCGEQNPVERDNSASLPSSASAAPLVYNCHRAMRQGEKPFCCFYSSSSAILENQGHLGLAALCLIISAVIQTLSSRWLPRTREGNEAGTQLGKAVCKKGVFAFPWSGELKQTIFSNFSFD